MIRLLSNLHALDLMDWSKFSVLPNSVGNAKNLWDLYLDGSEMHELLDFICS